MNISVFGLGYVGAVTCGCLAKQGHTVIGVDVSQIKVDLINGGHSPVVEPEIDELIKEAVVAGRLRAVTDALVAISETDISFISVGTPSQPNGNIELRYIRQVCIEIGQTLKKTSKPHLIVVRSTMLPGSMRGLVIPTLEEYSGRKAGRDFSICFNPEFLREGTSVYDFFNPPKTVVGSDDPRTVGKLREIYTGLPGPFFETSIEVSEMVKYADNSFHAVKITFANEIGLVCKSLGIDSHKVMDIFCEDRKLNISSYYLKPGFAYGGSCLPKDVNALLYHAKRMDLEVPLLQSLVASNQKQVESAIARITAMGKKRIGFLGFSFKAGTDDLRGSPVVQVIETLAGKGYAIALYDRNVQIARLVGANQSYVEQHIPHVAALMKNTPQEVVAASDIVVVGNSGDEFREIINGVPTDKLVLDLVRLDREWTTKGNYIGLAW
ncbi:MAG TPA: UDP-glucose/GDP-mannose dehydrogenase family protein [Bacteroidota bacterium]|nr:UDP-glucose/GDP-mannose dehydrogenase family protein [Bacteroidota bacterium]